MISKHISLDNDCIGKMKPYLDKHDGNMSAAMREIIGLAERHQSRQLPTIAMDKTLFEWILSEIEGRLIPDTILAEILDRKLINSMEDLEKSLNEKFKDLGCKVFLRYDKYDNDLSPSSVSVEIRSYNSKISTFVAGIISQFLVRNSHLGIKSVVNNDEHTKVELISSTSNLTSSLASSGGSNNLNKHFGYLEDIIRTIKHNPDFWKSLINLHSSNNYNMVTIHKDYFEDLLAGSVGPDRTIENLARKPLEEIPLNERLSLIKRVYENSGIFDRVEISEDSVVIFHNFRCKEAIEKLKMNVMALLTANCHIYDVKSTSNMIVLTYKNNI